MEFEQELLDKAWLLCVAAVALAVFASVWQITEWAWWEPRRLERALRTQGLRGAPYRLFIGDLRENMHLDKEAQSKPLQLNHDIVPRVAPLLLRAMSQYGKTSLTWIGNVPRVTIMHPELMREILSDKFGHFGKPSESPMVKQFVKGLVNYDGEKWARHRRIINPAFHVEKLKCMLPAFSACCDELIARWENSIGSVAIREIDVWPELLDFTRDVISRTAFGSSFREARRIFQLQTEAAQLFVKALQAVYFPGYRFLPTPMNNRREKIYREVRALLTTMVQNRERAIKSGEATENDLLGLLLESNIGEQRDAKGNAMTTEDVVEECKLFYFAGHETTAVLLTWTLIVLSMYPTWQARAREEVLQVFGKNKPDYDALSRLKIMTMILYEVLRLYPPGAVLSRRTYKTVELGGITYPPGVALSLPLILINHDPEYWGEDVHEFKPERFAEGVSKASKDQVAFFPFGGGPRICIGQNFALSEAKMALSMILQHFSFELSPSYTHAPYTVITLQPQHGAPLMLHRL